MLVIRFLRIGKKNQPSFKIVVVEKEKAATSGLFTEEVGFYNPLTKEKVLKAERIKYWLSVGAKASPTVHNLLVSDGVIKGEKIKLDKKAKKKDSAGAEEKGGESAEKPAEAETEKTEVTPTEEKEDTVKEPEQPAEEKPAEAEAEKTETTSTEEKEDVTKKAEQSVKEEPVETKEGESAEEKKE